MKVIAISGWKGSGKDTTADYLVNKYKFKRIGFADNLKESVAAEYGIPIHYFYDIHLKEYPLGRFPVSPQDDFSKKIVEMLKDELKYGYWTPRALCILKGSTNRSVASDYWVKQVINIIKQNKGHNFVIPDMRYRSEAEQLKLEFGKDLVTLRINRFKNIDTQDPSERDLDNYSFDYMIDNEKDMTYLHSAIDSMLWNLNPRR